MGQAAAGYSEPDGAGAIARRRPATELAHIDPGSAAFERLNDPGGDPKYYGYSLAELPYGQSIQT
jgi:hypothetical protein